MAPAPLDAGPPAPNPGQDDGAHAGRSRALVEAGEGHHYVFRRNITDGELAYFHCYNPRGEPMTELVRVIGSRWPIEECFEAAKGEAGLDNYQVRLYHAWYRHVTLSMLALAFLAVMRHHAKKEQRALWASRTPWSAGPVT